MDTKTINQPSKQKMHEIELFLFSLARSNAVPETAGLHGETPSSRYYFTRRLRLILMAHKSRALEIPFPFSAAVA